MFKKIILSLAVSATIVSVLAEESICFKLEGKLGEEIKALVYKYKNSLEHVSINNDNISTAKVEEMMAQVEAKKIKQKEEKKKQVAKQKMADGKKIYISKCQSCHGAKADKEAYNKARALNSLSLEEMQLSIRGYQLNEYDRGLAIIMTPYANGLVTSEAEAVYQYIQTLK